jgi:hypothetical protein
VLRAISIFAGTIFLTAFAMDAAFAGASWRVTKPEWSAEDEKGYSDFIQKIGDSGCETPDDCINSDVNPFRRSDGGGRGLEFNADCADLVYMFRAYYAWKNGLPFTYVTGVYARGGGDIRYSKGGNKVAGRRSVITGAGGAGVIYGAKDAVSSGSYRVGPDVDDKPLHDLYPVKIQPGSVRPGTAIYDVNGHVALVYKVGDDGRVYYMDAHPDFTLTRSVYGPQFGRDDPKLGAGFKNFRPIKLVGYSRGGDGTLHGGRIVTAADEQIPDHSDEQYFGTNPDPSNNWKKGEFRHDGIPIGFYEYVRVKMANGKLSFNPVVELKATIKTLCNDLYDRARFVEIAIDAGIDRKQQPQRLPNNIYGTDSMEWEIYSTPSRDARLKTAFKALRDDIDHLTKLYNERDSRIAYDGIDLKSDLQKSYDQSAFACTVSYVNSGGKRTVLTFDEARKRLFKMSFDPYHCIERRWGATARDELASCPDNHTKQRWYEAEQRLRNQIDRTYDARMDFTVGQLEDGGRGSGADNPPDIDVKAVIDNMGFRVPFKGMVPPGY